MGIGRKILGLENLGYGSRGSVDEHERRDGSGICGVSEDGAAEPGSAGDGEDRWQ
jgi:hypothetical protein